MRGFRRRDDVIDAASGAVGRNARARHDRGDSSSEPWDGSEPPATASGRQKEFESRYGKQLVSESTELGEAYSGLRDQRRSSSQLAVLASTSTRKIAEAVGGAIISLQAGDSTRQRLEHVCHGLGLAS